MAIHADQLARLVHSILARGLMTLFAFQLKMFTLQLEPALLVRLAREKSRLELQLVMTGVTICAGGAALELAVVNVFVAIAAESVCHGSAKIIILVTLCAVSFGVFPM